MATACQEAGLEPPGLEEIGTHFRVTISSVRIRKPNADETDQRIVALLGDGVARSTAVVAKHVGLSERGTPTRLKSMTSWVFLSKSGRALMTRSVNML
jgi:ATP-dependent DNA helicase RecG